VAVTNVLLTCAGRRNYLVTYFRCALRGQGAVFTADATSDAPAMQEADRAFVVPPVRDPAYVDTLLSLCRRHHVRLVVPLNDLELPVLARCRDRFLAAGTIPVVAASHVVDRCFDKWATFEFLRECGLRAPQTYLSLDGAREALSAGTLSLPLVIKPRWGTASIGIEYVDAEDDLEAACRVVKARIARSIIAEVGAHDRDGALMIQERLDGDEHGLDIINDLDGRYQTTLGRRKLSMRAGETDRAVTLNSPQLQAVGETLGRRLGHVGNLDCDVFVVDGQVYVLEMNPRFGGGYPFCHLAGADLPAALLAWADGRMAEHGWLRVRPDVVGSKCDRVIEVQTLSCVGAGI
jgi:carbamoyl-phosphate synthase large subunit